MFCKKSEIFIRKFKSFMEILVGAIIFSCVIIFLFLIGIDDEILRSACSDFTGFGLAFLAGRICYVYLVNKYTNQKKHRCNRKKTKPHHVITSAATTPVAPVVKPMFFDYEEH